MSTTVKNIRKILIVGGGTAGWMAAAALARVLGRGDLHIQLVESDAIGTVGVGEATLPELVKFNQMLGIDETAFMRATGATFKLGIEFVNWGRQGDRYLHPFGTFGADIHGIAFHHYWLKFFQRKQAAPLADYSLAVRAAMAGKFAHLSTEPPFASPPYAYQFDAGRYAQLLRQYAETRGVERCEGEITHCSKNAETGDITAVHLANGQQLAADFFIDCSGFRSLLLGEALQVPFENWQHWLPCDRAFAVASKNTEPAPPYTRATAHSAGWQWRIPLQHRTGNGLVFCSQYLQESQALDLLLDNLPGEPLAEPKLLKFTTGRRAVFWEKNCIAMGLAAGFMEPLESTSIHLVQSAITKFIALFPRTTAEPHNRRVFNTRSAYEFDRIRDFLILHYKATERDDSTFWRYCADMSIPDYLAEKLALYRATGRLFREDNELFSESSWLAVCHGQHVHARDYHPVVDTLPEADVRQLLEQFRTGVADYVKAMPHHADYIARYCPSADN